MQQQQQTDLVGCPEHVAAVFLGFPDPIAQELISIRALIRSTHENTANVGELVEDLRWGQPSYLTARPVTGTTLRLGTGKCGRCALFVHCQTRLIETFRGQYGPAFEFEGNRALVLTSTIQSVQAELAHCIEQALIYKLT